MRKLAL